VLVFQSKDTVCCGAVPEPVSDSIAVEFDALLINVALADEVPEAWGVNVT
jgi:hypothetical protein